MIDDTNIDIWSCGNFASIEDIRRKCNPIVNLPKLTFNKKKYIYIYIYKWSGVVTINCKLVSSQTLSNF